MAKYNKSIEKLTNSLDTSNKNIEDLAKNVSLLVDNIKIRSKKPDIEETVDRRGKNLTTEQRAELRSLREKLRFLKTEQEIYLKKTTKQETRDDVEYKKLVTQKEALEEDISYLTNLRRKKEKERESPLRLTKAAEQYESEGKIISSWILKLFAKRRGESPEKAEESLRDVTAELDKKTQDLIQETKTQIERIKHTTPDVMISSPLEESLSTGRSTDRILDQAEANKPLRIRETPEQKATRIDAADEANKPLPEKERVIEVKVVGFNDESLKKLEETFKNATRNLSGGMPGISFPSTIPAGTTVGKTVLEKGGAAAGKYLPKLKTVGKGLGLGLLAEGGIMAGNALKNAGYNKTGKTIHGAGTLGSIGSMALMGSAFGPVGTAVGALTGIALNWKDLGETFSDATSIFKDSVDTFSWESIKSFFNPKKQQPPAGGCWQQPPGQELPTPDQVLSQHKAVSDAFEDPVMQENVKKLIQSESGGISDESTINPISDTAGYYQFSPATAIETANKLGRKDIQEAIGGKPTKKQTAIAISQLSEEQQTALYKQYIKPLVTKKQQGGSVPSFAELKAFGFAPKFGDALNARGELTNPELMIYDKNSNAFKQNPQFAKWDKDNNGLSAKELLEGSSTLESTAAEGVKVTVTSNSKELKNKLEAEKAALQYRRTYNNTAPATTPTIQKIEKQLQDLDRVTPTKPTPNVKKPTAVNIPNTKGTTTYDNVATAAAAATPQTTINQINNNTNIAGGASNQPGIPKSREDIKDPYNPFLIRLDRLYSV